MKPKDLDNLSRAELIKLRDNPAIGDVAREKINARLVNDVAEPEQKSTDPRQRMNGTELRYSQVLDVRIRAGEIVSWAFEEVTFRVGLDRCRYTPDFVSQLAGGAGAEVVEVKGAYIRDDARVKFLAAAKQFPWLHWRLLQWANGEWRVVYDFAPTRFSSLNPLPATQ